MEKILLSTLIIIFYSTAFAAENINFTILYEKKYFERQAKDAVYSAVIYNQEGFDEFLKDYPISIDLAKNIFDTKVIIVGFSDSLTSAHPDRLEQKFPHGTYLTLSDGGVEYKRVQPNKEMKYTAYCIISVDRPFAHSHIQIREGISGLCKQYGKN